MKFFEIFRLSPLKIDVRDEMQVKYDTVALLFFQLLYEIILEFNIWIIVLLLLFQKNTKEIT